MTDLRQPFLRAVRDGRLWEPGMRVVLAVSGGADSMALLDLAAGTAKVHGAVLQVVTVDHGQHPQSSAATEAVIDFAASLGVPAVSVPADLEPGASEAEARAARYAILESLDTDRVALAHHERDQAETVLLNLLRGTGPRGLRGMVRQRDRYVRPLLGLSHEALLRHVDERELPVVEDPANASDRFLRNRVRRRLLPLLEELRAGSIRALARSATRAAEDDALLESLAAELPLDTEQLATAPTPLARRRIEMLIGPTTTARIDAVMRAVRAGGGRVELDARRAVVVTARCVLIEGDAESAGAPR